MSRRLKSSLQTQLSGVSSTLQTQLNTLSDVSGVLPVVSITVPSSATLDTVNLSKYVFITSSGSGTTLTLPSGQSNGKWVVIRNNSANGITINGASLSANSTGTYIYNSGSWTKM